MSKYIDADKLKAEIEKHIKEVKDAVKRFTPNMGFFDAKLSGIYDVMAIIDSLQQDKESVELELCSQTWWEERGWIMIPPDATIEGIDSLLKQVRKKLQQEQQEVDLEKEMDRFFEEMPIQEHENIFEDTYHMIARHFYELGLNARKKE